MSRIKIDVDCGLQLLNFMNIDETKREVTVELDGKKMTGKWTKQLEDDLMAYHGIHNMEDEMIVAIKHEMQREQMRREIDAIVHPLLSDPMDMNGMYATTDKIMKVFEKYYRT